ncbi:MAG: type II toxin-antitoxin system prevent-host-death family antitoxin [bacterium]|nr:type II toxin-antitoxin system prevent-host-death family antitoxin [bacterium]
MPQPLIGAKDAKASLSRLLDEAEKGYSCLIVRHSKPSAVLVPAEKAPLLEIVDAVLREVGESLALSSDEEVIAAVKRGEAEIAAGKYVTLDL